MLNFSYFDRLMLEFSDAAYKFFPAKPSPLIIRLTRRFNQIAVLPGKNHRIRGIEIKGDLDAIKAEQEKGTRLLFVANHSTHTDPQFLTEIHRRMGIDSCFMAAYDVFLRSKRQAWIMQKMGVFSIDREGSDRRAMSAAIWTELLKHKNYLDLTGNGVNHPNDFGHRIYAQVLSALLIPDSP